MAVPRFAGGSLDISRPSKTTAPSETSSCPATILNVEVLPQPDGPSKQMYPLSLNLMLMLSTATAVP